ncbi:unnamed protein product [Timema podura]|uniref:Uncharacterized protein n=1 Tax=Timema podura TaxID=61482 RepID=A0ABN7P0C0_TIMPD|nr:unnamed protein product [Timema podura]
MCQADLAQRPEERASSYLKTNSKQTKVTYAIFSLGDLHGTSSSISSSLSLSSSCGSDAMLRELLVNMSGTGRMLGRRLPAAHRKQTVSAPSCDECMKHYEHKPAPSCEEVYEAL